MKLPTFVGIGAPKAATTWLFRCLQEHPEVFVAARKETNFFDYATIQGRWDEYRIHFEGAAQAKAVGEISTRYWTSTRATERIHRWRPDMRLFVSLRNPVDQVYSHFWHLRRQNFHQWGRAPIPDTFEEALSHATFRERLLGPARYCTHLRRWLARFDRTRILVIFYDDIAAAPLQVLEQLYGFIGVDQGFVPQAIGERGSKVRAGTSPRSRTHQRLHTLAYDFLNRRIYHPLKQTIGTRKAIRLCELLRARSVLERIFMRPGYPQIRPRERAQLTGLLRPEIVDLSRLVGRDLSRWLDGELT